MPKKTTRKPTAAKPKTATAKRPKVSSAKSKKKLTKPKKAARKPAKKKERKKMSEVALMPAADKPQVLIPQNNRDSLTAWLSLYMKIDGEACADQTRIAKTQDLERFLDYYTTVVGSDSKQLWTRSVSEGFQKYLKKQRSERTGRKLAPATINRVFATLRTAAKWIHGHSPFPAGNPMQRISDLTTPEPSWQGLTDLQMVRMKAAADQLLTMSTGANQWPRRDFALFHVLYVTAMRVSELIELDIDQYDSRYLTNVQRKGKTVTPKIFLVNAVRRYLDDYIEQERGNQPGPIFQTRTGKRFSIQQVDYVIKKIAGQANAPLPAKEHIDAHPHILRHTMLRRVREEKGLEYAIEYAGHVSEKYIRRYTMPSEQETESALEELFG
jgi:integrase/recombinase XerD